MKPKRPRTMTIGCEYIIAQKSWNESALAFQELKDGHLARRVTVRIRHPGDIQYLRMRLQEIETSWRAQLEALKERAP